MKKILRVLFFLVLGLISLVIIAFISFHLYYKVKSYKNMANLGKTAPFIMFDGNSFRDLNKNGRLDTYEDVRRSIDDRVDNLVSQMNVEEKAGLMFITMILINEDGSPVERPTPANPFSFMVSTNSNMIAGRLMNHFNILQSFSPSIIASWHNQVQEMAERTRLGIPITIASDPRHSFTKNPAAMVAAGNFSQWCDPLGLAAIRDPDFVVTFSDIARQEYLAIGIRLALHPMADLATEPRWARINGTFGEDAGLSAVLTEAYITGFQGDELGKNSVACMTKHFSGAGPQKDGWDAHFEYGAEQIYPGNNFNYHIIPFTAAIDAKTAQMMPYYGIPVGITGEDVGFAFNKEIITNMLRNRYGFDGVVCSDWSIISDKKMMGKVVLPSTGWGVPGLTAKEKMIKALDAGIDQFGGENIPELLVELVNDGKISEQRLDVSVRRLLRDKFRLGLFDNPYVDADSAKNIVGQSEFVKLGHLSQRRSIVLLKNLIIDNDNFLPLSGRPKIYIENINNIVANNYCQVVSTPEAADYAILRLAAPWQPPSNDANMLESFFHQGDLDFKGEEKERLLKVAETVPTIIDIYLDRPAVIPQITQRCAGLLANFGASDEAVLDIIFGQFLPEGKLPFELPSSMIAVENQLEDVPYDSENPLFPYGFGLTYEDN